MTSFSFMIMSTRPYTPKNKIAEITSVMNTCKFNAVTQKDVSDAIIIAIITIAINLTIRLICRSST